MFPPNRFMVQKEKKKLKKEEETEEYLAV